MSITVSPYLTFDGNCREAMKFYQQCLGGQLSFQTIGKSPKADKLPSNIKKAILHAELSLKKTCIMGSDIVSDTGLQRGNAVSLTLHCNSEKEIKTLYQKLSRGGKKTHPLKISFRGALFGDLIDKYGVQWILHYPLKKTVTKN